MLLSNCAAMPGPPLANQLKPDHAPTPFSAQEIREGCPSGHRVVHRIEQVGQDPRIQVTLFVDASADQVGFEVTVTDPDGNSLGNPLRASAKWADLQAHASFPTAVTTIADEPCQTGAGAFDCWKYTVTQDDGTEQRFWFAKQLPGPPVLFETYKAGERIYRMEMIEQSQALPKD